MNRDQRTASKKNTRKDRVAEVANTFEWLITAFVLAFVFRAFVMEAFRIPTGSMADTLMGAHFPLRCPQCGYHYDYGFVPQQFGYPQDYIPSAALKSFYSRCPNCGYYQLTGGKIPIANGDRILVLKCIYQFFEPQRWDVVVFKNPLNPSENYIKRLIGRPGENVQIIDGDIYINGKIARKPPKVQNELWMPIYNNDYQPVHPAERRFNGHTWRCPFDLTQSDWTLDKNNPTLLRLNSRLDEINWLTYDTSIGNDFKAVYAYNNAAEYNFRPFCSDLMTRFWVSSTDSSGQIGIALSKYETFYKASVDFTGRMVIQAQTNEKTRELAYKQIQPPLVNKPTLVKFANVDHQLIFQFGQEKLTYDLGSGPDDAGPRKIRIRPQVKIFGSGKLVVSHIAIFRDIHYTSNGARRATQTNPLNLGPDEFFVLGDNSPNSADGRVWSLPGRGNNGKTYRQGIVPRDYLVGKALFVYWPGWFRPFGKTSIVYIPNLGQLRFIYGGSNRNL